MEVFEVKQPGSVGLIFNTDRLPYDLPPQGWTTAHNVRFYNDDAMSARGWLKRADIGERCKQLDYNAGLNGNYWIAFGTNRIFTIQDAFVVTQVATGFDSDEWHTHNFQGIPIGSNESQLPKCQYLAGIAPDALTPFVTFPGWPATDICKLVVGYRNFVVALNITEDGDNFPTKIRWSDAAAPGEMPSSWDVADPTTLAGEIVLPAHTGPIVAADVLRDDVIIYTVKSAFRLSYVGGSSVMRVREIPAGPGAFGPHSVLPVKGSHVVMTHDDMVIFDGNQSQSIVQDEGRQILQTLITGAARGYARLAYNSAFSEIWFALVFPAGAQQFRLINTISLINGVIAQRDAPPMLDMVEMPDREATDKIVVGSYTYAQLAEMPVIDGYDKTGTATYQGEALTGSPDDFYVMGLGTQGEIYRMDYGYEFYPYTEYPTILERTDLNITGDENTCSVVACYPRYSSEQLLQTPLVRTYDDIGLVGTRYDGSDGGDPDYSTFSYDQFYDNRDPATLYIGSQVAAGAPVVWRDGKVLDDRRKVTTKARGVRHGLKIVSQGQRWRLSGYDLEFTRSGRR